MKKVKVSTSGIYDKENNLNVSNNIYNTTMVPNSNNCSNLIFDSSAVLDFGASGTFVKINANCSNFKTETNSIYVKETSGNVSQ